MPRPAGSRDRDLPFLPSDHWTPGRALLDRLAVVHSREITDAMVAMADDLDLYHAVQYLVHRECRKRGQPTPADVEASPRNRWGSPVVDIDRSGLDLFDEDGIVVSEQELRSLPGTFYVPEQAWEPTVGDLHRLAGCLRVFTETLTEDSSTEGLSDMDFATLHWLICQSRASGEAHPPTFRPEHCACERRFAGELNFGPLDLDDWE